MTRLVREIFTQICKKLLFLISIVLVWTNGFAQDSTIPGEVSTPYPTIINLAVEWNIHGDENQDGIVTVKDLPLYGPRAL